MTSQREGSPFAGLSTVALKEAADHLNSTRIHLVMLLVLLTAVGSVYAAIGQVKLTLGEDLSCSCACSPRQPPLPSFVSFLGFLVPLVAIALGFDGVNGEYSRRTMSRSCPADLPRRASRRKIPRRAAWSSPSACWRCGC